MTTVEAVWQTALSIQLPVRIFHPLFLTKMRRATIVLPKRYTTWRALLTTIGDGKLKELAFSPLFDRGHL